MVRVTNVPMFRNLGNIGRLQTVHQVYLSSIGKYDATSLENDVEVFDDVEGDVGQLEAERGILRKTLKNVRNTSFDSVPLGFNANIRPKILIVRLGTVEPETMHDQATRT